MSYVSINVNAVDFGESDVATLLVDKLWDASEVGNLAIQITEEAMREGNGDGLKALCEAIQNYVEVE